MKTRERLKKNLNKILQGLRLIKSWHNICQTVCEFNFIKIILMSNIYFFKVFYFIFLDRVFRKLITGCIQLFFYICQSKSLCIICDSLKYHKENKLIST